MEYRKFEQYIANTLYNDKEILDIDALISDIHGNKKKDRKGLFFWITSLCLIGILTSFFVVNNNNSGKKAYARHSSLNNTESYINEKTSHQNEDIQTNSKVVKQEFVTNIKKAIGSGSSLNNMANTATKANATSLRIDDKQKIGSSLLSEMTSQPNEANTENLNQRIQISPLSSKGLDFLNSNNILTLKTDKVVCPTFSNKRKLYMEIVPEFGVFLPIKKLENGYNEVNSVFNLRDNREKSLEGINAGLYLKFRKQKTPFYLKTGISWSKLTERLPLDYTYTKQDTTRGIISITYSQSGDTITTIIGDIITERKISGNKTRHHTISLWDLPLSLGYEKDFGPWFIGAEAGAVINLSMNSKGNILNSDTSFVNVNLPQEHYKSSIGLSYTGGLHFGRDFLRAGRIYVSARFRYLPSYFNAETNLIKQRYSFAGINLGYVWTF